MKDSSIRSGWIAGLMVAAMAAAGAYAASPKVDVTIQAHKEMVKIDAWGKKAVTLAPATDAATGDVVVYTLRAQNKGDGPAMSPRIEDPVPVGTVLMLDSLSMDGHVVEASLDGGKSWQRFPATVTSTDAKGAMQTVAAPAESYTTLRWVLNGPLQPGDGKDVTFKVRIR